MHYRKNRSTYSKKSLEKLFADSKGRKIPARYLQGLSGKAREKRIEELEQRRDEYDEMWEDGKATQDELDHVFRDFETDKRVRKKPSSYTVEAKRRGIVGSNRDKALAALKYYGVSTSKENVDKVTRELKKVYSKGIAAWASGGHRPGASKWNWAAARVNSILVGGKTFFTADKKNAEAFPKKLYDAIKREASWKKNPTSNVEMLLLGIAIGYFLWKSGKSSTSYESIENSEYQVYMHQ